MPKEPHDPPGERRRARRRRAALRRSRALRRHHARKWPYPGSYAPGNRVKIYYEGEPCYRDMLEAIRGARATVHLETYLLRSDSVGWTFAEALAERSRAGVECALMYDAVGGMPVSGDYLAFLRAEGVAVIEYHPVWPWRRGFNLTRRDHRKILTVDSTVGFVGGMNVSEHALPEERGGEGWLDVHLRVEGPAAIRLDRLFVEEWTRQGGEDLSVGDIPVGHTEGVPVRIVENRGHLKRALVRAAYMGALRHAKKSIWIMNGYFVPDRRFVRALCRAVRRGVDVRIIVPGKSDIRMVMWAGQHIYERLLGAGVRLFEWKRSVLHSKVAVVDGRWLTVGTFNLDHRSLRYNLEVNAMILARDVARSQERKLSSAADECEELSLERWRSRPVVQRLRSRLCYLFRVWL